VDNGRNAVSWCCLGADYERFEVRNFLLRANLSLPDGHVERSARLDPDLDLLDLALALAVVRRLDGDVR
jgi:hypothetical protein